MSFLNVNSLRLGTHCITGLKNLENFQKNEKNFIELYETSHHDSRFCQNPSCLSWKPKKLFEFRELSKVPQIPTEFKLYKKEKNLEKISKNSKFFYCIFRK